MPFPICCASVPCLRCRTSFWCQRALACMDLASILTIEACQVLTLSREVRVLSRRVKTLSDTASKAEVVQQ